MDTNLITIRPAQKEDADFVAESVLNAVGMDDITDHLIRRIAQLCTYDNVLYSWRNTLIAEYDNKIAGAIIAYKGSDYLTMKAITIHLMSMEGMPFYNPKFAESFKTMIPETKAGEYYLDSLYVKPTAQKNGIGTALIKSGIETAKNYGIEKVTLAVAPENNNARRLYESLDFIAGDQKFIFGEWYTKMIFTVKQ